MCVCSINSVDSSIPSSIYADEYPLGALRSNSESQTGAVDVQLPVAWEGRVQAETKTGSVSVAGEEVKIVKGCQCGAGFWQGRDGGEGGRGE